MVHINLLFNNFNIMCYSDLDQFRILHMGSFHNWCMLIPASFKLALMWASCMYRLLPWVASCSIVMHRTWLSILACYVLCIYHVLCFFPVVPLLDSSCFVAIVRIHSTTWDRLLHGLVLLPSGISGKMTVTLDLTTIFAMLVVSMLSLCRATYHLFIKPPNMPWNNL